MLYKDWKKLHSAKPASRDLASLDKQSLESGTADCTPIGPKEMADITDTSISSQ